MDIAVGEHLQALVLTNALLGAVDAVPELVQLSIVGVVPVEQKDRILSRAKLVNIPDEGIGYPRELGVIHNDDLCVDHLSNASVLQYGSLGRLIRHIQWREERGRVEE